MKVDAETKQKIVKNVLLSLFLYILPIALMFITFSITGQRPWKDKPVKKEITKSSTNKTNLNNGSND